MKIVHIIIGLNVGGAELMLKRLVESIHADHEVAVISLTDEGVLGKSFSKIGVDFYCLGLHSIFSAPHVFLAIRKILGDLSPDVVQTWMYHSDFIGGLAAKSLGIDNIYWNVRNTYLSGRGVANYIFRKVCALLSRFIPKKIVYVSYSARDEHGLAGYCREKSVVIGNGFDLDLFSYKADARPMYRDNWGLSDDDFVVCSIGRFDEAKDHITFVKAVKEVRKRSADVVAVMVGKGIPHNEGILREISEDKGGFILLDSRNDIPFLLSACDLFCLHSITEGFPNVLGEAMSVGLPCVSTRAGDAELILGSSEYVCDIGDYSGLAEKINYIKNLPEEDRAGIGCRNKQRVEDNYSLSSVVEKYVQLYEGQIKSDEKFNT